MRTLREAMTAVSATALLIVTVAACGPARDARSADGAAATGPVTPEAAAQIAKKSAAPPVPTEQECRARASQPLSKPVSGDGEPKQTYDALFQAHHDTFRCCFDALYAPQKPKTDGKVTLVVKVDGSGKLTGSEIVAAETTATNPQFSACIQDVAKAIAYPKRADNKSVGYKRAFDFKARR
jgi:hypothetical protein